VDLHTYINRNSVLPARNFFGSGFAGIFFCSVAVRAVYSRRIPLRLVPAEPFPLGAQFCLSAQFAKQDKLAQKNLPRTNRLDALPF
jgi:hypothetical protein